MKTREQLKKANNAPVYACMYPALAEVFRDHGYALAIHGSMARDFDLIAIPWIELPDPPAKVMDSVVKKWGGKLIGEPEMMPHGRKVYTLAIMFGEVFLDLGFMPVKHLDPEED